jgi:hypothetical protein
MFKYNVSIAGGQELNCDISKHWIRDRFRSTLSHVTKQSKMVLSHSEFPAHNIYKPGGTAMFLLGSITGRHLESGSDTMGRWAHTRLHGAHHRRITIITCYQVNLHPTNQSGTTSFHQQQSGSGMW